MKSIIIPVILAVAGTGVGAGAGFLLKDDQPPMAMGESNPCGDAAAGSAPPPVDPGPARDYVKLNNQFIVPILADGRIAAMVVMSLTLEVAPGNTDAVFAAEPKLRDSFLQNMFDHANSGGFSGNFTTGTTMQSLRNALLQTARGIVGDQVSDILITDIVRQDS